MKKGLKIATYLSNINFECVSFRYLRRTYLTQTPLSGKRRTLRETDRRLCICGWLTDICETFTDGFTTGWTKRSEWFKRL